MFCKVHDAEVDTEHILNNHSTSLVDERVMSHMRRINKISWDFKDRSVCVCVCRWRGLCLGEI